MASWLLGSRGLAGLVVVWNLRPSGLDDHVAVWDTRPEGHMDSASYLAPIRSNSVIKSHRFHLPSTGPRGGSPARPRDSLREEIEAHKALQKVLKNWN